MPSFRDSLVTQDAPLDANEIGILEAWLRVLHADISVFGPTPEDELRMTAIAARIAKDRAGART